MKKYWEDSYKFSFNAPITQISTQTGKLALEFDETYFYPEGGGQPADRGSIAGFPVLDVQETGGRIIHYLPFTTESEAVFRPGQIVDCIIDSAFRIHNMRLHTGCHILFGAARRLFGEVGYAGFNIGEVGNLYLETQQQIRAEDLHKLSQMTNEVIIENRPIQAYFISNDQARKMKELAYNLDLPLDQVRIIEVEGWDTAACSGTHIRQTLDIGPIKIIAREIHKKNVTRIDYAVGKRAVDEFSREERYLAETAELLNTSKDQVPVLVRKLSGDLQTTQKELRKLREHMTKYRIAEIQTSAETIRGVRVLTDIAEYLDAGGVKGMASTLLTGASATLVAIIGGKETLSVAAGASSDLSLPISECITRVAKKYGGGGGGRPNFVTAGGIQSNAKVLLDEIKTELMALIANS
jgi:alanyl-tRNA synthetase